MPNFQFRKSSYSDDKDECVEVATNIPTIIAIRDSKTRTTPPLHLHPTTWETFRTAVADDCM
ncbi:DUF397 domain-containing protein [Streptomyces sp. GQFP]|uniref:DUF397 domain-containing protein n=1 Tax=Streptomyces sp. GQFP TaxID=2907545 RepID=UPI001F2E416E|nr:DUF397 domain-containing protein [Streptomyces sp. GQFP]UIX34781.1 DUF397 domain-containing protein [Streptomyces sp. GQFP]